MGILSRFTDIMRSNINAILEKAEDPAKLVDQYLLDAKRDLAEVKQETEGVMAQQKAAQRAVDECKANIEKHSNAAKNAIRSGNDDDAKKLIAEMQRYEGQLPQLEKNLASATDASEKMRQMFNKLTDDIRDLESRKATVKGTVSAAKAQEAVNRASAHGSRAQSVNDSFARMEQKANERLDRAVSGAEMNAELEADGDLLKKYGSGSQISVDEAFERMKAELEQ